jgi:hypothetical protein
MNVRTGWERHQLIEFLRQISLHPIRRLCCIDASLGIVGFSKIIQGGNFFNHRRDGDDGEMFCREWITRCAAVNEIFLGFPVWVEGFRLFEVLRFLLRFILRLGQWEIKDVEKEKKNE